MTKTLPKGEREIRFTRKKNLSFFTAETSNGLIFFTTGISIYKPNTRFTAYRIQLLAALIPFDR